MYDLIVVGSGPAGSTCARQAAIRGLDVLLIEKDCHPRSKPCGGVLSPRARALLDFDIEAVTETKAHGGFFYSPRGEKLVLHREKTNCSLVSRARFDALLMNKAKEAGVETIENSEVVAIEQTRKGIRVLTHGDSHRSHLLVGADGVNGVVAKAVGIRHRWPIERLALCINDEVPVDIKTITEKMALFASSDMLGIELYFGQVEYGYAWCFPKGDKLSIGIGAALNRARNLRSKWRAFVKSLEARKEITLDVSSAKAFRVPIGGTKERLTARRTMLIGDAAGLVSPVTGEGIYYALESGRLAAVIADKAIEKRSVSLVRTFDEHIKKRVIQELESARFLANAFYRSQKNIELVWKIANDDPQMREYILDLVLGTKSPMDLRKSMALRLIARHPVKAIRLGL